MHNLREQVNSESNKLRNEEIQKTTVEERLEKALHDLHHMRNEHTTVNNHFFIKNELFYIFYGLILVI